MGWAITMIIIGVVKPITSTEKQRSHNKNYREGSEDYFKIEQCFHRLFDLSWSLINFYLNYFWLAISQIMKG